MTHQLSRNPREVTSYAQAAKIASDRRRRIDARVKAARAESQWPAGHHVVAKSQREAVNRKRVKFVGGHMKRGGSRNRGNKARPGDNGIVARGSADCHRALQRKRAVNPARNAAPPWRRRVALAEI